MRAGRTFPRWLSLCAAALVLLQLGGLVHLAAAPHGICWEHGVVVELDAAPVAVRPVVPPEGLSRAGILLLRNEQHPHCPALWILRQARLERAGAPVAVGCSDHPAPVVVGKNVPPPAGWALHRAPKQSPPV
jgi:hypothetical protein